MCGAQWLLGESRQGFTELGRAWWMEEAVAELHSSCRALSNDESVAPMSPSKLDAAQQRRGEDVPAQMWAQHS